MGSAGALAQGRPRARAIALAALALLLAGCMAMLPKGRSEVLSSWDSYDAAYKALSAIEPYVASRGDVHAAGLDPQQNPAVTVLHFADLLQRFSGVATIGNAELDRGIRDCLRAGKQCSGYAIAVKKVRRDRVGNFWLDLLNFKRDTETTGWSVEALLVFVDDQLVYTLIGGQPTIREHDVVRNPLGPLQSRGDAIINSLHY